MGNTVTITGVGSTIITASQIGNANYNPASDVTQTLTVSRENQTITFPAIPDKTVGDVPFSLNATTNAGLNVVYSTTSDKITIATNQVSIVKAGRASISANQGGNTNINVASVVNQSFCIKPAKPTVSLSGINKGVQTLTSNASTGNQWFLNGTAIAGATNSTLTVASTGTYKVQLQADDCLSDFSADVAVSVTGDLHTMDKIEVYPNPAENYLEVRD